MILCVLAKVNNLLGNSTFNNDRILRSGCSWADERLKEGLLLLVEGLGMGMMFVVSHSNVPST